MGILTKCLAAVFGQPNVVLVRMPRAAVSRDNSSVLQQRGWRQSKRTYAGPYATPHGTWHGRIEPAGDVLRCYIKDPPTDVVSRHEKWPCFAPDTPDGWWRIHLAVNPINNDPNAVILYVERILVESFRRASNA